MPPRRRRRCPWTGRGAPWPIGPPWPCRLGSPSRPWLPQTARRHAGGVRRRVGRHLALDEPPGAALHVERAVAELDAAVHHHAGGLPLHLEALEDVAVALRV